MEKLEWIVTLGMDTIKIVLLLFGILGFEVNKGKWKYISLLYVFIGIPIMLYFSADPYWYVSIWKMLFILAFMHGTTGRKIQCFFFQMIVITLADLAVVGICINLVPHNNIEENAVLETVCEAIAVVIWFGVVIILKSYRTKIQNYIKNLSAGYIAVMLVELFCMLVIVSCIYGIMVNEMTEKIQRRALFFCVMAVILNMFFCFLFSYMSYSKSRIKLEKDMAQRQMELQKSYYERMIHQDEGMRKFCHDIGNVLQGLEVLKNRDDIEGMKEYIDDISETYRDSIVLHTGNDIADYFINGALEELKNVGKLDYKMEGNFPAVMHMKNSDWCILIANAIDNAKEALLQLEQGRQFCIEVKRMKQGMWFCISNSVVEKQKKLLETTKKNRKDHGYGIENMKSVVEKYGGKIDFRYEQNMFCMEVYLLDEMNNSL